MKPILIHVHIFYVDMWEEIKSHIMNIKDHAIQLHVTLIQDNNELRADILQHFPNSKIHIVPNRGFDVAPFFFVLDQLNLADYSYVIKLHTKRDVHDNQLNINGFDVTGCKWRNYLLRFLSTPDSFKNQIDLFQSNPSIGMLSSYEIIAGRILKDNYDKKATALTSEFIAKQLWSPVKFNYIAGTMFIVRSHLLQKIKDLNLTFDNFPEPDVNKSTQLAHVMERILGYTIYDQGFTITDATIPRKTQIFYQVRQRGISISKSILNFIYQKKCTSNNKLIIKFLKIPIFHKNISSKTN